MDRLRFPATVGAIVSALAALVVLVPYFFRVADADAIATYYDFGVVTGLTVLMIALVTVVVFASGRQGRSEPAMAAGAALGLGVVAAMLAVSWALAVPTDVIYQLTSQEWFEYHRWAVVASTVAMALCGIWYAYVLRLF